MSGKRNIEGARARARRVLDAFPDLSFTEIATKARISRMHLYRLAARFPEVGRAYQSCLSYKKNTADLFVLEALTDLPRNYRIVYSAAQDSMRYAYYLSRWEHRREPCPA